MLLQRHAADGFSRAASNVSVAKSEISASSQLSDGSRASKKSEQISVSSKGTINMSIEEKKALRAEAERKKKAAKKKREEEERQRRLAEEAERARIAAFEFLQDRANCWTPWQQADHFSIDLRGFVSIDGARKPLDNVNPAALQEADEAWDPDDDEDRILHGAVGGEFLVCTRQSFPVLTRVSGYSEARSKRVVLPGEKAEFKIKLVSKHEASCWSIGIVRNSCKPGQAWSTNGLKDKAFYLNTARSNLFNGPHLQYFESDGDDGPYAVNEDFGRTGSTDFTTKKGAWYGQEGWTPPLRYAYNNQGPSFLLRQDDTVDLHVDLESDDGELKFIVNNQEMPNTIKGIRRALQSLDNESTPEQASEMEVTSDADEIHAAPADGGGHASAQESEEEYGGGGHASEERIGQAQIADGYVLAIQVHAEGDAVRLFAPPREDLDQGQDAIDSTALSALGAEEKVRATSGMLSPRSRLIDAHADGEMKGRNNKQTEGERAKGKDEDAMPAKRMTLKQRALLQAAKTSIPIDQRAEMMKKSKSMGERGGREPPTEVRQLDTVLSATRKRLDVAKQAYTSPEK